MSDERVSYMYQRDPSIDRRYRPRPNNVCNLFRDISEEDESNPTAASIDGSQCSMGSSNSDTIDTTASVFLRLRPEKKLSKHYMAEKNVLKVLPIEMTTTNNKDMTEKHFEFTQILHIDATQLDVYNQSAHAAIQNGESLTILTYGTSGSGKTYTMYGSDDEAGIVQRSIVHIFSLNSQIICNTPAARIDRGNFSMVAPHNAKIEQTLTSQFVVPRNQPRNNELVQRICDEHGFEAVNNNWQYVFVWISFAEIYNENVYDLLKINPATATKRKNLKIIANDGNAYIKDLTSVHVMSASDAFDVISAGLTQVNYATTNINDHSSRSHCILIVDVVHFSYPDRYSTATYKFCDLAGSERLKKTENEGSRLREAQRINTSLMVLGRCFDLMFQNQQSKSKEVVPFRESKLTMLLQKALLGHEKITTIVTMAPKIEFMDENLHVLNFASIAQQIVYKQPKPQLRNRRVARSSRFSWFMNSDPTNKSDDMQDLIDECARMEEENEQLRDIIQQMTSDHAKKEQMLRHQLVGEREAQMKTATEKWQKRLEFEQKKSKEKVI